MSTSTPTPSPSLLHWTEGGEARSAVWQSERGALPPKRVVVIDDSTAADTAYRMACEGTGLLWRGDFQNARLLVQAMARRVDKPAKPKREKRVKATVVVDGETPVVTAPSAPAVKFPEAFHLHRQAQAQRARVLGMVLIPIEPDYSMTARRAPDARKAFAAAWGPADVAAGPLVTSLREISGLISANEWRRKGVEIAALGDPPNNRIHPYYGVFSPIRGEYIDMVAQVPIPSVRTSMTAFDIGTGTGVLAAVLARRGVERVVATDLDARALACARNNLTRMGLLDQVELVEADLFPEGKAALIVCNPPWLPARPSSPIEHAIYDEGGRMLMGFINGLAAHLAPGGEGWLILSDLAEHLKLRSREELLAAFDAAGLEVADRIDAFPNHPKAAEATDALHAARAAEVTSMWRLVAK